MLGGGTTHTGSLPRPLDLLVSVRGDGHHVGGRALCDGGMVDGRARTARVQGGEKLGDLDREMHLYGLAVPAGVVSTTGVAGLTLGGR